MKRFLLLFVITGICCFQFVYAQQNPIIEKIFLNNNNSFGFSSAVAVSGDGNTVIAASPNANNGQGGAFVYTRINDTFIQTSVIYPVSISGLGYEPSLGISRNGKTVVMGFWANNSYHNKFYSGIAFIFTLQDAGWQETAVLLPSVKNPNFSTTYYGVSVAISEDGLMAAVGAPLQQNNTFGKGIVYVYKSEVNVWSQDKILFPADNANVNFGNAVSMSQDGKTIAVGDPEYNYDQGRVFVFEKKSAIWNIHQLPTNNVPVGAQIGTSIAIAANGEWVLAGAPYEKVITLSEGAAYSFNKSNGDWLFKNRLIETDPVSEDEFGWAVSLSSDASFGLVGCHAGKNGVGAFHYSKGKAYYYKHTNNEWKLKNKLVPQDGNKGDAFGYAVSISEDGKTLCVGAPFATLTDFQQGYAYIYSQRHTQPLAYSKETLQLNNEIKLYPNPVKNILHIDGLPDALRSRLTILDFTGTIKATAIVTGNSCNWNISELKPDNYLLRIEANENVVLKKFVIGD